MVTSGLLFSRVKSDIAATAVLEQISLEKGKALKLQNCVCISSFAIV